ncbi:MAG: hypothetical protein WCS37_02775 [Chloroflexota bacterium]|nr:hypothetical protein [Chloroflexota bacterium]
MTELFTNLDPDDDITIALAEKYSYSYNYVQLNDELPYMLKSARNLAEEAGALSATKSQHEILDEPAEMLNQLVAALYRYLLNTGRSQNLREMSQWAYQAALYGQYPGHYKDAANRAVEMAHLTFFYPRNWDTMTRELKRWLTLAEKANDQNKDPKSRKKVEANILLGYGLYAWDNSDRDETGYHLALDYVTRAFQAYKDQDDLDGQVYALLERGRLRDLYFPKRHNSEAQEDYLSALKLIEGLGSYYYQCECYLRLGWSLIVIEETESAEKRFEEARELASRLNFKYQEAEAFRGLARNSRRNKKDINQALKYAEEALKIERILKSRNHKMTLKLISLLQKQDRDSVSQV